MRIPDKTVEHVSAVLGEIIDKHHGLQLHGVNVYLANRGTYADYRFRIAIFTYRNLSKFLRIKYTELDNIYYFEFDVDINFAQSRSPLINQIVDSALQSVVNPLLEALDEFNFDSEVTNLLATEYN